MKSKTLRALDNAIEDLLKSGSKKKARDEEEDEDIDFRRRMRDEEEDEDVDYRRKRAKDEEEDEEEEEDVDEDVDFEEDDEDVDYRRKRRAKDEEEGEEDEEEEEDDIDEDRALSDSFKEDDMTWEDDDDEYTTGGAKKLDASYGGPNMPGKLMNPSQYSAFYKRVMARAGQGPDTRATVGKSFTKNLDRKALEAIDVSPFLRNLTKAIGGSLDGQAALLADFATEQMATNRRLSKAIAAMGRAVSEISEQPTMAKSRSYSVLQKGGSHVPDRQTALRVLEKSVYAGEIAPETLTNYELSNQLSPEGRAVLAQNGLM